VEDDKDRAFRVCEVRKGGFGGTEPEGRDALADRAKVRIEKKLFQQLACAEQGQFLMFQDMHEYYIDPVH
jgi:hypothetical protein